MSYYNINDFINVCRTDQNSVFVFKKALDDANNDFIIDSKSKLLKFIGNNGLEELTFINTKKWENNPNKIQPILIDAYEFKSMYKLGYIAFMYNNKTNKWNIKSFHLSDNRDISIEMALRKANLI
ncbi:MAG: hypothetical protein KAT05_01425 [Spirochaetes bacterium]|nr:hypothetical protein [Spirochaetota bacterium]